MLVWLSHLVAQQRETVLLEASLKACERHLTNPLSKQLNIDELNSPIPKRGLATTKRLSLCAYQACETLGKKEIHVFLLTYFPNRSHYCSNTGIKRNNYALNTSQLDDRL